jgi:hypothetical protein
MDLKTQGKWNSLTTALDRQNTPVNDMLGKVEQMVFTSKLSHIIASMYAGVEVIILLNTPIHSIH